MRPFFSFFYYGMLFVGLCLVTEKSLPGAAQPIASLPSAYVQGAIGRLLAWSHSAAGAIPACCNGLVSALETGMQRDASWGKGIGRRTGLVFFGKRKKPERWHSDFYVISPASLHALGMYGGGRAVSVL